MVFENLKNTISSAFKTKNSATIILLVCKRRDYVIRNNEKTLMSAKQNINNLIILKT